MSIYFTFFQLAVSSSFLEIFFSKILVFIIASSSLSLSFFFPVLFVLFFLLFLFIDSKNVMLKVRSPYGGLFERRAIHKWLHRNGSVCPLTGLPLASSELTDAPEVAAQVDLFACAFFFLVFFFFKFVLCLCCVWY